MINAACRLSFVCLLISEESRQFQINSSSPIAYSRRRRSHVLTLQDVSNWDAADVISLLVELIAQSYTHSQTVLPTVRRMVSHHAARLKNITDLPDRLLVQILGYLDDKSLEHCQEVSL